MLRRRRAPPAPQSGARASTWRAFLTQYRAQLLARDCFTVGVAAHYGLDHDEVRGWHHHTTMTLLARNFLLWLTGAGDRAAELRRRPIPSQAHPRQLPDTS